MIPEAGGTSDRDVTQKLPIPTMNDSGNVSIGKIQKNNWAFRMNAASRKVFRKVLTGFIITKPALKGVGSTEEEDDAPGTE